MFAKVENGVTKSCQKFRRKIEKSNFGLKFSTIFEQDRLLSCCCLFARVEIGVTAEFPDKNSQKRFFCEFEIYFKSVCASLEKNFFLPRKNELWGGYNFKTG